MPPAAHHRPAVVLAGAAGVAINGGDVGPVPALADANMSGGASAGEVEDIGKNYLKSSKAEGLGIGLQVIKSILEAMGTSMKMQAREEGGLVQSVLFAKWSDNDND